MFELTSLDGLRVVLALIMLGIACVSDIKKREIHDLIWIVFGGIAAILIPFGDSLQDELYSVGISLIVAPVAIIIWRFGLFGGADAFALIVLAALVPGITLTQNTITPFTVLTNAVIVSIIPLLVNVTRNCILLAVKRDIFEGFDETISRKIFAMFIGYRATNPKFGFSIERKVGNHKKLNLSLQHAENTVFCEKRDTWVTPGIPYMIFIATGYVLQLVYGDIIFSVFSLNIN
ncbi:MAG: A24 family peptidase C-terminal domain-containing protein [Candidatus Nitrosotenuis sp.]